MFNVFMIFVDTTDEAPSTAAPSTAAPSTAAPSTEAPSTTAPPAGGKRVFLEYVHTAGIISKSP